ncbi:MAG: hypothetical protein E7634_08295 [Ruminococcaceae bacterium]|nr:hypothetical protein [Oscillospiraceae bacterium]
MIFNTHERTPKIKTNKKLKAMLIFCWSLMGGFFLFMAIVISIMSKSIAPALIIIIPVLFIGAFGIVLTLDMNKAHVKIEGENITVVDYYFFTKKEKHYKIQEITSAKILLGSSLGVKGYRIPIMFYIVFRNNNNKYLFKIINCLDTEEFFGKYFELQTK